MRKCKYILSFALIIGFLQSCEFLDENPEGKFVTGNFYSTASDAEAAMNAVYYALYGVYNRNFCLVVDLISDDYKNGTGMSNSNLQDIEYLRINSENTFNATVWKNTYIGIVMANTAINNIGNATMEAAMRDRLIGEAKFLRALNYFNAVRLWSDVPLVTKIEALSDAFVKRNPKAEVYNLIVQDLEDAADALPYSYEASDIGRATKGAAKILLGKVYLTLGEWQAAADVLAEVIDNETSYGYTLNENYRDNWEIATENGSEMVFSVQFAQSPAQGNYLMAGIGPKYSINSGLGVPGIYIAWEADIPTLDLYNAFDNNDERKSGTFKIDFVSPTNGNTYTSSIPLFYKYWETGETTCTNSDVNFHILRYSDALLMYAEALNELNHPEQAESYINRVRERAFNDTDHDYTGLTQPQLRDSIRLERRLEFACEGQRYFDLIRWGIFVETMQAHGALEASLSGVTIKNDISNNVSDANNLYPIPQHEIDLNSKLEQNPGY